jgi:hypothetical protein
MAIGQSGRIVIEIDPKLKQELHAALVKEGSSLKHWFILNAEKFLLERQQIPLELQSDEQVK